MATVNLSDTETIQSEKWRDGATGQGITDNHDHENRATAGTGQRPTEMTQVGSPNSQFVCILFSGIFA